MYTSNFKTLMPRNIFFRWNETKYWKERKKFRSRLCVQSHNTFEERLDSSSSSESDYLYEFFLRGEFLLFFSFATNTIPTFTRHSYIQIFWINILCNMKFSRRKNCSIFISPFFLSLTLSLSSLLGENMYIFYGKEVVLRAYVYSSDFINWRDNWSTYTER